MLKPSVLSYLSRQPTMTSERSPVMMESQGGFLSNNNMLSRFSQPLNMTGSTQVHGGPLKQSATKLSFASPIFPLRNRTNLPSGSSNFLLQTIIRDSQQIKMEYDQYRRKIQTKLTDQERTIRKLKDSLNVYKKKILEMKLQKEVYVARESHAFQEIQKDLHHLLQKVSLFAEAESLKVDTLPSVEPSPRNPRTSRSKESGLYYNDLVENIKNLENKIVQFESKSKDNLASCKVAEKNLKSYMTTTNEKLDQIMFYIMENRGSHEVITGDADASLYNASVEDNQDSDTGSLSPNMVAPEAQPEYETEDNVIYEVPTLPSLKSQQNSCSSSSSNNVIVTTGQLRKRKSESTCSNRAKVLRKRLCPKRRRRVTAMDYQEDGREEQKCSDGDDSEKPPPLILPCRLAKRSKSRLESMPILLPEADYLPQKEEEEDEERTQSAHQENRKDDALIGIKRESSSNEIHGKDFSKIGFVCVCGAKFTGAGGLYVHQVKTMENEKFSCRSCGKKFHYFSGLKAHRKSAHKQEFTQEVGCSRCGQIFKSKRDRQGHLDERGQTCWLSGSYQSKDWEGIRNKRNLPSSYSSSSASSSQNAIS